MIVIGKEKMTYLVVFIACLFTFLIQCPEKSVKPDDNQSDTTSHNFVWEMDTLGLYGSYLNDVAIVDENNIWVVGEIIVDDPDSSYDGTGKESFNAARWNGEKWNLMQIYDRSPLYSIFYFCENDMWVTSFGFPEYWDGNKWTLYHLQNMGIDASVGFGIWGTSSSKIYFVGYAGSIVEYNGSRFRKMTSGTDTPIIDIWGIDENHIWATAKSNQFDDEHPDGYESVTLFYDGIKWIRKYESLVGHTHDHSNTTIAGYMNSVWAFKDTLYISSNSGLWKESIKKGKGKLVHGPDNRLNGYPFLVRGTGYNDVYAFTHWGEFLHYNGKTWNRDLSLNGINISKVDVKNNLVVTVGDMQFRYVVIVRGHHI
ncbi:MAG: hypothetical protein PHW79_01045 [Candidatus Marinimicrobia bacterium]|nr:hypothetical protein [Candidatus Neomarinimicrobiota bacterium]